MDEVSKHGRTVLFVSHQMGMLAQLCRKAILLEKGEVITEGKTDVVINTYLNRQKSTAGAYYYDENKVAGKNAYIVYQKIVNETGVEVSEITNEQPIILETKIRLEKFQEIMELSLSLQSKTKGRIFTVDIKLKDIINSGEKEKIVRLEIPPNVITPNLYSWISSIHLPGTELVDVLYDECDFFINDVGSEFARYEGMDYGCINLTDYKIQILNS